MNTIDEKLQKANALNREVSELEDLSRRMSVVNEPYYGNPNKVSRVDEITFSFDIWTGDDTSRTKQSVSIRSVTKLVVDAVKQNLADIIEEKKHELEELFR